MFGFISNLLKKVNLLYFLGACAISIILILLPLSIKTTIGALVSGFFYYPLIELDHFLLDLATTKKTNIELNRQLADKAIQLAGCSEMRHENARLRRMLEFDIQTTQRLVPAKVIAARAMPDAQALIIGAGADKGIRINNPVVTADGIVGKTIAVSAGTSTVQLLTDHNCRISAIDQNTRTLGIIRWKGGRLLEMGDVPVESQLAVGDTVVSSGLGGIFPAGLMIGTVVYAKNRSGSLFKDVLVRPAVKFWSIEEVFVILYGR